MKKISITLLLLGWVLAGYSQTAYNVSFTEYQRNFPRLNDILRKKEDSLRRQFAEKGLTWPAKYIYLRSFKYDSQLEVGVQNDKKDAFQLFKTYKVCALTSSSKT